ncbi:hypothetical protein J0383_01295 [Flavobacterium endoglycinae]|uniref:GOLD domain-containing protein n=1 Tax=Flavobacterium endoglycinae TaxID=2816357 RepID=A0ABX7QFW0_9FLAO|nr:hypothetical protein [Flavobacterium endoglycinae]QSW89461.1 hypothetical protein J0383_01295 [Flavobacterium endoglycinae]
MKSFKLKSILVVLFLSISIVSCSNDDDEKPVVPNVKAALVTEIKGPATGKVNDELSYEVTFVVDNACGEFDKISEVTIGAVKGLQVIAKYPSEVCIQQVPDPKKTVYKFKATAKGTYDIKFKKSETEFLTQKVVIE